MVAQVNKEGQVLDLKLAPNMHRFLHQPHQKWSTFTPHDTHLEKFGLLEMGWQQNLAGRVTQWNLKIWASYYGRGHGQQGNLARSQGASILTLVVNHSILSLVVNHY